MSYTTIIRSKKYIHDFSNIKNSELKDIKLWDDYIIYAIIFNNSNKLIKENYKLYRNLYKQANKNT